MKTLSAELLAELQLTATRPGYLVRIDFSVPLRLSTLGTISWDSQTWTAADLAVGAIEQTGEAARRGQIALGNAGGDIGALVLDEDVAGRAIAIWAVWAGQIEPLKVFSGIGDEAEIGLEVRIGLAGNRLLYSPRRFVNAAAGFNTLLPAGTKVTVGGQTFVLER